MKIYTECGNNLKLDKNLENRNFVKGQLINFGCSFKGKGAKTALAYQNKNTNVIDHHVYCDLIIFKVLDVAEATVTLREVDPFTGKFYKEAKLLVCPKWTEADVYYADTCVGRNGDIIPCGKPYINGFTEKCWIPTETYNGVALTGGFCYHNYVTDAYRGKLHVADWNDGAGIAEYATITAPNEVRMKPYKLIKKTVTKTYLEVA